MDMTAELTKRTEQIENIIKKYLLLLRSNGAMFKCEVYEEKNQNGEIVYGIKCGETHQLISRNFVKVQKLTNKCNKYGIDPIHLRDIIDDAQIK